MIMNSKLRQELTELLADHLTMCESARILRGERPATPWERWMNVAEDAMDFIYDEEGATPGQDPDHRSSHTGHTDSPARDSGECGSDGCGCDTGPGVMGTEWVMGPDGPIALTGVFDPPTSPIDLLREKFVQIREDGPRFATEESDPARGSGFEQSAPSSPGQAEAVE